MITTDRYIIMEYALTEYALFFKALSDETRLKIFKMLNDKSELCACNLLEQLNITQPTLSYHMKILSECKLVFSRKDGSWMRYKLNSERVSLLQKFLNNIIGE